MSSNNSSPGNDYDNIIISDSRSMTSEEDEDDESGCVKSSGGKENQHETYQQNHQNYELAHPQELEQQHENIQQIQYYQDLKNASQEQNIMAQRIDMENIKMRLSQVDIRDGNSTPNSPSYLLFAPDQIKLNNQERNYAQEKIEKQLLKTLEEFSPISRMEDSRGDMTVQMFDLSMMQSRDLHHNLLHSQGGQSSTKPIKSSFSTQVNQLQRKEFLQKNPNTAPSINQIPPNAPQPQSMTRLTTNSKQEQKTQKLRERFEKYSHQMMNNINLQKTNNEAGQQKNHTKSVQNTSSKNLAANSAEAKRVQAIKGSSKNSKVSTPLTSKNTLNEMKSGDGQFEQKREKSQNSYQKPTQSSTRKSEQPKTERNTPSNQPIQNIGNMNVAKTKKQNLQQSLQQQQQIQVQLQKKISSSIPNEKSTKQQNLVQAKFLLASPQRNKHLQNATGNNPTQRQSLPTKAYQQDGKSQRYSDFVGDYEFQGRNNQMASSSPKNRVNTVSNTNNNTNNYMSAGANLRKYSDNMNDRSLKKSYSQENINFARKDSYNSQQSGNKQSSPLPLRKQSSELSQQQQAEQDQKDNIDLITIRQQYRESFDNYLVRKSFERKQSEELRIEDIVNDDEQKDEEGDIFSINIYKNQLTQQKSGKSQNIEDEDEEDASEIPQLYNINRSQSQHQQNVNQPETINDDDGKNNSQNFMRRSYTQDNMLQHAKQQQQQQQQTERAQQQLIKKNSQKYNNEQLDENEQIFYSSANNKDMIFSSPNKDNILFSKEQITEDSFSQNGNIYIGHYQAQHNNPKTSPNNFNNQNVQQHSGNSNFTTYTNAMSHQSKQQNSQNSQQYKVVSSAKYIDQDEDEVLDSQAQYFTQKERESSYNRNKEEIPFSPNQQQLQNDLKVYNIPQKQRKSDLVQNSKSSPNREINKTSPRGQGSLNNNFINLGKNVNYYNSCGNEKPISQRYSEQTDVRKKTDTTNKSQANNSNASLNLNNPICLYNLHKESSNKNTKSNNNNNSSSNNNNPLHNQNSNYYSMKEANVQNSSRRINVNQQKEQPSPSLQDSPIKLSGVVNSQNLQDLKQQSILLQQQIIDISQKSKRGINAQSIHIIEKPSHNSYSQQPQRSHPTLPNDSQLYGNNQTQTTAASQVSQQYSSQNIHTFHQQSAQTNPATPQSNNPNANQQSYAQHSQYAQQFQQKQAGRIVSQRDMIKKKEKFIRNSNDFKIQQEQDIIDKALQRKGSSGNFRGSYKDSEDCFKRKLTLAKSFQGDNSASKNNVLLANVSLNENYNSAPGELKTLQNFFKSGSDLNSNANKRIISQFNQQQQQSKTERQETQATYTQLSQSIQANKSQQNSYQNGRKNSSKTTANEQSMTKQPSKGVESQKSTQKTPRQNNNQQSYVEDSAFTDAYTTLQQQQQQKQAIQIQKMLGKCFNTSSNDTEYFAKGKSQNRGKDQKVNSKATSNNTYDTNIDYILKHLKETSNKQSLNQAPKNQNSSFNLNNKSITSSQQPQKQQQKQSAQSTSPPLGQHPKVKESFSKYHQLIQEKVQKTSYTAQGQTSIPQKDKEYLQLKIQQLEQEIPKIQQLKNQFVQDNNIIEQQNQLLKAQMENV